MYLIGDIGGTKTHLALVEKTCATTLIAQKKYKSKDHTNLLEIIVDFLKENPSKIQASSFGIAGPVKENKVQTTNLPWIIDAQKISQALECKTTLLLNDLQANAYGLFVLEEKDFFCLNQGVEQKANQALVSAGTGLGEAGLFFDGNTHIPFACEGGHCDFAPVDEQQIRLLEFTMKKYPHVSYERFLSGAGIELIYRFLLHDKKHNATTQITELQEKQDLPRVITEKALAKTDPICSEALDLFVSIYGSEAGNTALKFLALGGVFLGGGIPPKILPKLREKGFFDAFKNKGRFESLLESIPVKVVLNEQTALFGAAHALFTHEKGSSSL